MLRMPSVRDRGLEVTRLELQGAARAALAVAALALASCPQAGPVAPWNSALTPTTHQPFFPIASAPHAADCNVCHGGFDTFAQFDCSGCHAAATTDAQHAGLSLEGLSYRYESAACYDCHPLGKAERFDHRAIFPIAPGDLHAGLPCAQCHEDPADRTSLACVSCHTQSEDLPAAHQGVGGFAEQTALCLRCHPEGQAHRLVDHLPFSIVSGAAHYTRPCLSCHPRMRADKPFGADFTEYECTGCHEQAATAAEHAQVGEYVYLSTSCTWGGCHRDGSIPR